MNTDTFPPTARTAQVGQLPLAQARDTKPATHHRLADYIVDVFFIVLLAAPFVIFQSPASVQDAVVAHSPAQPAADTAYGPE